MIFLDHADSRTPAGRFGLNDLQSIIDGIIAAGWPKVMIDASGFNDAHLADLPVRTWAMARHYGLFDGDWRTAVANVVRARTGAVNAGDLQFVDYVDRNRRGSTAILELEVPSESQRFRQLSSADQNTVLALWAQAGRQRGFRTIYPLFVPGTDPDGNQATEYDSATAGTLAQQRSLMQSYG